MDLVVVYDIATDRPEDQRRLRAVAKVCEGFGVRVQDSVFECRLGDVDVERMKIELADVIDPDRDSIYFYQLHATLAEARYIMGARRPHEAGSPWMF